MSIKKTAAPVLALLLLVAAVLGIRWLGKEAPAGADRVAAGDLLEGVGEVAERFPAPEKAGSWSRDMGAKPGEFAESWLFAGRVHDRQGRPFGFQLEITRIAIRAEAPARPSAWAAEDIYRARFSVEPEAAKTRFGERLSRAALGLAGADGQTARAWVENWRFVHDPGAGAIRIEAGDASASMALRLEIPEHEPVVVEGELHAGHWWPRLQAEGTLTLDGRVLQVSGTALLERLWGKALPSGQGQLALARLWLDTGDGGARRCQQLRRKAGGGTPLLQCQAHLSPVPEDVDLAPLEAGWQTIGGTRWPLRWTVRRDGERPPLDLAPLGGERPLSLAGNWSGIVVADDDPAAWGLLELSNFAAP